MLFDVSDAGGSVCGWETLRNGHVVEIHAGRDDHGEFINFRAGRAECFPRGAAAREIAAEARAAVCAAVADYAAAGWSNPRHAMERPEAWLASTGGWGVVWLRRAS